MKPVDLNALPYSLRSSGASMLVAKANRLCGMMSTEAIKPDEKSLRASIAYYDMALALMKPYDPNYVTVINWKCNALLELGQFEEAVSWYREILRISDETDGKGMRNAYAVGAEEMIRKYDGQANAALEPNYDSATVFDDPPFCMFAVAFCETLAEHEFKKARANLSPQLQQRHSVEDLKQTWTQITKAAKAPDLKIVLLEYALDWPGRDPKDIAWCYVAVTGKNFNEAVNFTIGQTPENSYCVTDLEFGRP